eukprot:CAMPEP_0119392644 /NCGR_PEP_ID=MMETSP1334-20130426/121965_1 /TAXON_ID=127549 /ORGANISM="Calcidiscus leptoporus, Strain RCC1130" /LENGTH=99 /DNA_ID=CAMNT_0007415531 /DNA_START=35 /DNA_END=330 /DNA_ORIENTATION=-
MSPIDSRAQSSMHGPTAQGLSRGSATLSKRQKAPRSMCDWRRGACRAPGQTNGRAVSQNLRSVWQNSCHASRSGSPRWKNFQGSAARAVQSPRSCAPTV